MRIIGLTGQSGAGKGTVAKILEKKGIPHIDCDGIYHLMLTPDGECTKALAKHFGIEILAPTARLTEKNSEASFSAARDMKKGSASLMK